MLQLAQSSLQLSLFLISLFFPPTPCSPTPLSPKNTQLKSETLRVSVYLSIVRSGIVRKLCFETFNFKASRCYTGRGRPTTVLPSPLQRPQSDSVPPAARARSPRKFEAGTRSPRPGAPEPAPGSYTSLQLRSTTSCTCVIGNRE